MTTTQQGAQRFALDVRYHSTDDMGPPGGELAAISEPVAVVLRPDGSVDVYGCIAIVDQRQAVSSLPLAVRAPEALDLARAIVEIADGGLSDADYAQVIDMARELLADHEFDPVDDSFGAECVQCGLLAAAHD